MESQTHVFEMKNRGREGESKKRDGDTIMWWKRIRRTIVAERRELERLLRAQDLAGRHVVVIERHGDRGAVRRRVNLLGGGGGRHVRRRLEI